jgi:2-polyprenyl-3-methyl-5-hydroxy-6-metoxy-1,4-benzoquinol methylase
MANTCPLCASNSTTLVKSWHQSEIQTNYDLYEIKVHDLLEEYTDEHCCNDCGLKFFRAEEGSETFYNRLMAKDWYYPHDKTEFKITAQYITENDTVLEVGAGTGNYFTHINPLYYQGLEFNPQAVKEAKALGRRVNNQTLAELDQLYTVVVAHQVLEHVKSPSDFIQECLHCLLPNGLLIYTVPSEEGIMGQLPNYCLNQPPHHMTKWQDSTLTYIAQKFNLKLVDLVHETQQNPHHLELLGRDYTGFAHTVVAVYKKI